MLHNFFLFVAFGLFTIVWSAPFSNLASDTNPTITIASGVVIGTAVPFTPDPAASAPSAATSIFKYLGIPFAATPTSSLRFAPPVAPTTWAQPLYATTLPSACMQQFTGASTAVTFNKMIFNNPGGTTAPSESEDCLYLNVFTPVQNTPQDAKKPVLFWIFGGNLQFGTGSLDIYDGSSFAALQDVVVVTINYRTNIFGFSASPEIPAGKQNVGYLDQRMALQWVQDNIDKFGGDPTKVTLFGESAGGYSIKQLIAQPPSPLPFHAAIMESAQMDYVINPSISYNYTLTNFGCESQASPIACLRQVSATDLVTYISQNSLPFAPVEDKVTQTYDIRPLIQSKSLANVPILIGTNAAEGRVISAAFGYDTSTSIETAQEFTQTTFDFFKNVTFEQSVLSAYSALQNNIYLFAAAVYTDLPFTCTTGSIANLTASNGYSTWRYIYNAAFPNQDYFPNPGAYHSSEIAQVFGTYTKLTSSSGGPTSDQAKLSLYMQTTWANFAKNPSVGPGWPAVGTNSGLELGNIGGVDNTGENTVQLSSVDSVCTVWKPLLDLTGY